MRNLGGVPVRLLSAVKIRYNLDRNEHRIMRFSPLGSPEIVLMPPAGQTGRRRHNVLSLPVRSSVSLHLSVAISLWVSINEGSRKGFG